MTGSVPEPLTAATMLPASTRRTLHITRTGSDAATGTQTRPWRTLARAINQATPGDQIRIAPGIYPEPWPTQWPSGTPEDTITITADNPANYPVIKAFPYLRAQAYWRLNRLELDGTGLDPNVGDAALVIGASSAGGPAHHIEISQTRLQNFRNTNGYAHGLLLKEGCHHIDLLANLIQIIGQNPDPDKRFHQHGIYLGTGHHARILGNQIQDIHAGYGLHWWGDYDDVWAAYNTTQRTHAAGLTIGSTGNTGLEPERLIIEYNAFLQTAQSHGSHHVTNYSAQGRDIIGRNNYFDPTRPPVDTRLNGGSTREGIGTWDLTPAPSTTVGHQAFTMPDPTPPDPCAQLRVERDTLKTTLESREGTLRLARIQAQNLLTTLGTE